MRNTDFDKFSEHSLVLRNYAKNFDTQLLEEIENIVKQKEFSNGLGWYKWDWNDTAKELGFGKRPVEGFIAQEVEKLYPDTIIEKECGYKAIMFEDVLRRSEDE